ncbi:MULTISPECIES: hypothetical protein [Nonomuraea]|uniref:PE domain-containing protein n=2 Tax=Nonomuraea TaxID=83681 RepID=A0ABW1BSE0_9ACTN|nr:MULTISPECIES: hypothetical protein [Nonomuraea]MDA0645307.1 hypothetical protein [Nonomuraea ferruginea]TXK36021.1 hypothetical protein FR742_43495 [Nonomuraea sp. C10]
MALPDERGAELPVDPNLFDARENSPASMRVIAQELRASLEAMLGNGERPNGNVNQIATGDRPADEEIPLTTSQIGQWNDASALAATVGSQNAGQKFAEVYQKFIDAYRDVVEAVEASAANHDGARQANEG